MKVGDRVSATVYGKDRRGTITQAGESVSIVLWDDSKRNDWMHNVSLSPVRTVEVFTLEELKAQFPAAYARVLKRWERYASESETGVMDTEVMDSLKAVVEACGATLDDWSIGAYSYSWIKVSVEDRQECENCGDNAGLDCELCHGEGAGAFKGAEWFRDVVAKPLGYFADETQPFPGLCKFTGVCYDDDFLEKTYESLQRGLTLTDALQSLAGDASRFFEGNAEQLASEEEMENNWYDMLFTAQGVSVGRVSE